MNISDVMGTLFWMLQLTMLYVKLIELSRRTCLQYNRIVLNNTCRGGLTEWLRSLIGNQVRRNSPVGSSPMSSARKALEILSSRAFFMASVLGTAGYSLCCPGERDLNTSIFKLFSSFFPCRPVITVIIKSCSGIIVTNIILYGPDVHVRVNKR